VDEEGVTATKALKVGATIELTPDEGPVGTVVEVEGRGFTAKSYVATITMAGITCYNISELDIDKDGEFKGEFVIPSVAEEEEEYTVTATDGVNLSATDDFEVTGLSSIETTPMYGAPNDKIDIEGFNFTAIKETEVELVLVNQDTLDETPTREEFETDEDGEFSGTFKVPALDDGDYTLIARQADYMINATVEDFRVGLMIVIVAPSEGATGLDIQLTGVGFTGGETWNATLGEEAISKDEEEVNADGTISHVFYVPTVDVGTYTITVMDIETEIEVTTEFEVTYTTTLALDPAAAPNEYNVTIEGWYFSAIDGGELYFVVYNETDDWDMDVKQEKDPGVDAVTNEDGNFTAWWEVLDDEDLSLGDYTINVTDGEDLFAQIAFSIAEEYVEISALKTEYYIGDTVAFDIKSSFEQEGSYINILDPDGDLYFKTDDLDTWISIDTHQVSPYYSQTSGGNPMTLPTDAPLGTWSWDWDDEDGDEIDSGTFIVAAAPEELLEQRIADLETTIEGLSDDLSDLSGDLSSVGDKVTGLEGQIADVIEDVGEAVSGAVDEAVSEAMTDVDAKIGDLESTIGGLETQLSETDTKVGGLSTLVYGAIGASLVAALAAIVSLMQISRRIAG